MTLKDMLRDYPPEHPVEPHSGTGNAISSSEARGKPGATAGWEQPQGQVKT